MLLYEILVYIIHDKKNKTCHIITVNLKYQFQRGTKKLNYLMDKILYQKVNH